MWDIDRDPPALLSPGTAVRFERVRDEARLDVMRLDRCSAGWNRRLSGARPASHAATHSSRCGGRGSRRGGGPSRSSVRSLQLLVQDAGRSGYGRARGLGIRGGGPPGDARREPRSGQYGPGGGSRERRGCRAAVPRSRCRRRHGGFQARSPLEEAGGGVRPVAHGEPFATVDGDELTLGHPERGAALRHRRPRWSGCGPALGSRAADTARRLGPLALTAGTVLPIGDAGRYAGRPVYRRARAPCPRRSRRPGDHPRPARRLVHGRSGRDPHRSGWTVTPRSDRVGIRLQGQVPLERALGGELPSEGAVTGAIQVPPDGQPVLFLPDHPLTGGYPIIGALTDRSLDLAGQLAPECASASPSRSPHDHRVSTVPTTQRVLIANRGEIAVRVHPRLREAGVRIRRGLCGSGCRRPACTSGDEAVGLGGVTAADTYLSIDALLAAARQSGATAVHPGYGFLSESAAFARAVEEAGLVWIGPTPASIDALGDKMTARRIAQQVGAPLAAGTDEPLAGPEEAVAFAEQHGLPIGDQGGIRRWRSRAQGRAGAVRGRRGLSTRPPVRRSRRSAGGSASSSASSRARDTSRCRCSVTGSAASWSSAIATARCSAEIRSSSRRRRLPALSVEQRTRFHDAARSICGEVRYRGAGTVEFLLAADGTISFLEVNTRLQVEHPVTEEVTGTDLVREQFRIAFGEGPSIVETPKPVGHASSSGSNAEDPGRGFLPSPGRVERAADPRWSWCALGQRASKRGMSCSRRSTR